VSARWQAAATITNMREEQTSPVSAASELFDRNDIDTSTPAHRAHDPETRRRISSTLRRAHTPDSHHGPKATGQRRSVGHPPTPPTAAEAPRPPTE
jgi:hypothetical protein